MSHHGHPRDYSYPQYISTASYYSPTGTSGTRESPAMSAVPETSPRAPHCDPTSAQFNVGVYGVPNYNNSSSDVELQAAHLGQLGQHHYSGGTVMEAWAHHGETDQLSAMFSSLGVKDDGVPVHYGLPAAHRWPGAGAGAEMHAVAPLSAASGFPNTMSVDSPFSQLAHSPPAFGYAFGTGHGFLRARSDSSLAMGAVVSASPALPFPHTSSLAGSTPLAASPPPLSPGAWGQNGRQWTQIREAGSSQASSPLTAPPKGRRGAVVGSPANAETDPSPDFGALDFAVGVYRMRGNAQ